MNVRDWWRRLKCAWWTLREESCDCPQQDALEVLCRVFDDGADVAHQEWLEWYKPSQWLHPWINAPSARDDRRLFITSDFQRGWRDGYAQAAREIRNAVDGLKAPDAEGTTSGTTKGV